MKIYPALDVRSDASDHLLAILDDFSPTALEERNDGVRVFFARVDDREAARTALAADFPVAAIDVPDEDWGRRSQENLQPITIGRVTIHPRPLASHQPGLRSAAKSSSCGVARQSACGATAAAISIVIQPSMGFGTGHHATTRLCLEALQAIDLAGASVTDVGTGSGVLAIAAVRLGAARAIGIDIDEDAIHAARENLTLNPEVGSRVTFEIASLSTSVPPQGTEVDILTANLTGHLLVQSASALVDAVRSGGILILSGLQVHEREAVARAFSATSTVWERSADEWVGLTVRKG